MLAFFPLLHFPLKALFVWFSDKYILCVSPLFARPNRFVLCAVNSDVFMVVTDPYYSTALAACLSRRVDYVGLRHQVSNEAHVESQTAHQGYYYNLHIYGS